VQTTEATKITCRVDNTLNKTAGESGTVIVFLKTSEEAKCETSVCGGFLFTNDLGTVTGVSAEVDATSGAYHVKFAGTNMPTSASEDTQLFIDGKSQTLVSASDTETVFSVANSLTSTLSMKLYFAQGKAIGHEIIDAGLVLQPKLVKITPNTGSVGGTAIVASVPGVGSSQTTVDVLDSTGSSICDKVSVISYGQIECISKRVSITSQLLKVKVGTETFECTDSACNYEQAEGGAFPVVSSAVISGTTIVFTGSDFYTSGYTASASFNGVSSDTTEINSATQVTATWTSGVPIVAAATQPELKFTSEGQLKTAFFASAPAIENALQIASSSQDLSCSFAGGCTFEISAPGLTQMLKADPSKNNVTFCENAATLSEDSSADTAKLILPALSTRFSDTSFSIQTFHNLKPFRLSGTGT